MPPSGDVPSGLEQGWVEAGKNVTLSLNISIIKPVVGVDWIIGSTSHASKVTYVNNPVPNEKTFNVLATYTHLFPKSPTNVAVHYVINSDPVISKPYRNVDIYRKFQPLQFNIT